MRMKACPQLLFGCLALIAGLSIVARPIWAQSPEPSPETPVNEVTLMAIPPRLGDDYTLKAKPGEKIQTVIRVRNNSEQAVSISTSAEDFIVDQDGKTPIPVTDQVSTRWSLTEWMTVSPAQQTIDPGKSGNINVIVDVPDDALPGGHYAMVVHQPAPAGVPAASSQSSIGQRVGTLVYFMVEGPINEEAFVHNLSFPKFTEYGPVDFSMTVDNVSDIHIKPQVTVEIYNVIGQKVDSVNVESFNVFPMVPRQVSGSWNRVWGIGFYKARAVMSYGTQGQIATAQAQFWLLPIRLVIAVGVGILAVLGIILAIRRHLVHRQKLNKQKLETLERKIAELEQEKHQD